MLDDEVRRLRNIALNEDGSSFFCFDIDWVDRAAEAALALNNELGRVPRDFVSAGRNAHREVSSGSDADRSSHRCAVLPFHLRKDYGAARRYRYSRWRTSNELEDANDDARVRGNWSCIGQRARARRENETRERNCQNRGCTTYHSEPPYRVNFALVELSSSPNARP